MKALKTLVAGMGLLLVVGLGFIGWGISRNMHSSAPAAARSDAGSTFTAEVMVPAGSRLDQMTTAGDRIVLRFSGGDGDRILVVDPHNGQVTGRITLVPESR